MLLCFVPMNPLRIRFDRASLLAVAIFLAYLLAPVWVS